MSIFDGFGKIESFIIDAQTFLTAIANSLELLHGKVDSVTADVAVLKSAGSNVDSVAASVGALTDVLAKSSEILNAVNVFHGQFVATLPVPAVVVPVAGEASA